MLPPLDIDSLRSRVAAGERFEYRLFWGHKPRPDGQISNSCFSQWWACRFEIDGQSYSSAEQFMMAAKARLFDDPPSLAQILNTDDPGRAKA